MCFRILYRLNSRCVVVERVRKEHWNVDLNEIMFGLHTYLLALVPALYAAAFVHTRIHGYRLPPRGAALSPLYEPLYNLPSNNTTARTHRVYTRVIFHSSD